MKLNLIAGSITLIIGCCLALLVWSFEPVPPKRTIEPCKDGLIDAIEFFDQEGQFLARLYYSHLQKGFMFKELPKHRKNCFEVVEYVTLLEGFNVPNYIPVHN